MIIKGTSRGNPKQLAAHLLRTDTNERIKVLELNSPTDDLTQTLRDWQTLTTATEGTKGLYHANISPGTDYTMTEEQWIRSADVLAEQLGLSHQPRGIYLHEKDGREHIHIVWQRTNTDTMTLVSDSWNYLAHEQASLALEQEFGHELVPGKHTKRDREKQPEFPRAETNHAEWQQAERTGIDPADRKAQIQALKEASDNAQAFKTALEEAGYILAKGDRGYLIVDQNGDHFTLARQLKEKTDQVNNYMAAIPLDTLPALEEAKTRAKEQPHEATLPQPHKTTPEEPSYPLTQQEPDTSLKDILALEAALKAKLAEEARTIAERHRAELRNISQVFQHDLTEQLEARRATQDAELSAFFRKAEEYSDDWMRKYIDIRLTRWNWDVADQRRIERQQEIDTIRNEHRIERDTMIQTLKLKRDQEIDDLKTTRAQQPTEKTHELTQAEIDTLTKALNDRHTEEAQTLKQFHQAELDQLTQALDRDIRDKMTNFDAMQEAERNRKTRELFPELTGADKLIDALKNRLDRGTAKNEKERQWQALMERQEEKRTDKLANLYDNKRQDIEALKERHDQKQRELKAKAEADLARYIQEEQAAKRLLAAIEKQQKEEQRQQKDGLDPPSHKQ